VYSLTAILFELGLPSFYTYSMHILSTCIQWPVDD